MTTTIAELLQVKQLQKTFDGFTAVQEVSFAVQSGQIKALIGPNGAGKTTILNMISGVLAPSRGEILLQGTRISGLPPHRIAAQGIARTFQHVELFHNMSVVENVMIGRHLRSQGGLLVAAFPFGKVPAQERRVFTEAMQYLDMVQLAEFAHYPAGELPFGRQRLLEIARALASEPKLLLLDEAASGLSSREKQELVALIFSIRQRGVTIFLVDHDMDLVMGISDEVVVVDHGEKIAEGIPAVVQNNEQVIAAYLGEELVDA